MTILQPSRKEFKLYLKDIKVNSYHLTNS